MESDFGASESLNGKITLLHLTLFNNHVSEQPLDSTRNTIMSTQYDGGIDFSIVSESDQQHFRLLELPAELLQVITSKDPPMFVCPLI